MKGGFRKIGIAVMSVLLALIVFRLLPAQTSDAAALAPIPASVDYFHDNSGYYFNGDDSVGKGYSWIGTYDDPAYGYSVTVLQFDLSSIPVTDTVASANLKLFVPYAVSSVSGPPLFVTVHGSNDDDISESSEKIPSQDVTIVSEQTGIRQGEFLNIDLTSYIKSEAVGDRKATLVLTGNDTPNKNNQFAIHSNNALINKPALEVITATNAKVSSVKAPPDGTYVAGQAMDFIVNFDRIVKVTGVPSIPVTVGSSTVQAVYASGSGSTALTFRYMVTEGELDTDGVSLVPVINLNGGAIRNTLNEDSILALQNIDSLSNVKVDSKAPTVSSVEVPLNGTYGSGQSLQFTVNFDESVILTGGTPSLELRIGSTDVQAVYINGSGSDSLEFVYILQDGQSDTDGVDARRLSLNGATIKDAAGNAAVVTLNNVGITKGVLVDTTAPTVDSVGMPDSGTYKIGDQLEFTVRYNENVSVTGTPVLPVTIGTSLVQANYVSGSGTPDLLFRYIVQPDDLDADGVELGSSLVLNGGTLRDAANNNASLALTGIEDNTVLVDAVAPKVNRVTVPPAKTYLAGQDLEFTVIYNEAVTVTGVPYLPITIGGSTVQADYQSGSGTSDLVFRYTVQTGDLDTDGITVVSGLNLNGGTIKDAIANNAVLTLTNVDDTTEVLVDAVAPSVIKVEVPESQTYGAAAQLDFTVNFDKKVVIDGGTPFIPITIGSSTVHAEYLSGTGTDKLIFRYTVQAGDYDIDGIEVGSAISLNGSTMRDEAGNEANLTLTGVDRETVVLVDTTDPVVTAVAVPADSTYIAGEALEFTVHFDESVVVTGTPSLPITIGTAKVQASYVSGTGTNALIFGYTVLDGQEDADGIEVGGEIALNGGTLKDAAGNSADINLIGIGDTSQVRVDAVAPSVVSIVVPEAGFYRAGSSLNIMIHYDEEVTVTGTPSITLTLGSTAVQAVYASGSGTKDIAFAYSVQAGDEDLDGIELSAVTLNGGALNDAAGNAASLSLVTAGSTDGVLVDTTAPSITSVEVPGNGIYKTGDSLTFTVHYNEKVLVNGGTPFLPLTIDSTAVQAVYVSGSGTNALAFRYEVQAGDTDSDGIELPTSISLNGSVIADNAGNAAGLALTGAGDTGGVLVDTTAPVVSLVSVPSDGMYHAGANLDFVVKISESVILDTAAGAPYMEVQIGSAVVKASYLETVSTTELKFRYVVRLEDQDSDGISVEADALVLSGAVIKDAAGNHLGTTLHNIGATQSIKVSNNFSVAVSESNWTNKDVTVTVTTDPDNTIEYKLGSRETWAAYTAPVVVTEEGLTTFSARVIDPENHVSEVKSAEVKIDKTAPVIVLNGEGTINVYIGNTYTEQGATVQDANPAAPQATVTGTVDTANLGTYTLRYNTVDLAGNPAVEVIRTVKVISRPASNTNVRQVTVEAGDPDHPQVIVQINIEREIIGGEKVDTVIMNEDKIKQAVEGAVGAHQGTIRIIVDDIPGDPADQVKVKLTVNTIKYLLDSSIQVEIQTENATLHLSTEALGAMKGSQEFFFDILPIRKKDEQDAVKDRTINAEAIRSIVKSGQVKVIGMPMTIETNIPKVAVQVTFPLDVKDIPSDAAQRKLFLAGLGVYIEHSDGDKVFQRGKIVYNDKGAPVGIQIEVNKFSTFTIVSAEGAVVQHGAYMTGYADGTFRPNHSVTRAEISTMLYRLLSGTLPGKGSVTAFKDVPGQYWAAEAIRWGQQVGLLNGYPDRSFKPNETITRAEMATIIAKWMQLDPAAANPAFRDAKGHWASGQIAAAAKLGYMTGYADGTFRPDQPLTRAEAVVILNRILDRGPLTGVTTPAWKDVPSTFWAFGAIEEASRSHQAARDSNGREMYIPQ